MPQGRRLWRSLTVDEHLRADAELRRKGAWTIERIYDTFPRLAERKNNGGGAAFRRRAADAGDLARAADQPAAAHHGRADRRPGAGHRRPGRGDAGAARRGRRDGRARDRAEHRRRHARSPTTSRSWSTAGSTASSTRARLAARPRAAAAPARRRRGTATTRPTPAVEARRCAHRGGTPHRAAGRARRRPASTSPIPTHPDALVAAGAGRAHRGRSAHAVAASVVADRRRRSAQASEQAAAAQRSGPPCRARRRHARHQGRGTALHPRPDPGQADVRTRLVDLSTSGKHSGRGRVRRRRSRCNHPRGAAGVFASDRGASVAAMAEAFDTWMRPPERHARASFRRAARARPRWSTPAMRACPSACRSS